MDKILENLYLGSLYDVEWLPGNVIAAGVTSVLNVCHQGYVPPEGLTCYHMPMNDGTGNNVQTLVEAVKLLDTLLEAKETVLVHCQAGISRSPTVIAVYLALTKGITLDKAYVEIVLIRDYVDPHWAMRKLGEEALQILRKERRAHQ